MNDSDQRGDGNRRLPVSAPPIVASALAAANTGNREAFLDCFVRDGFVNDWGSIYRGRDAIGRWSDREFIGVDVTLDVLDVAVDGRTTTVGAQVGGNGFSGLSHFAFVRADDHLASMTITG